MELPKTDPIQFLADLTKDRDFYKTKLEETERLIRALQGALGNNVVLQPANVESSTSVSETSVTVSWADEIRKIFSTGAELSIAELRERLYENGIAEVQTPSGKNSVYSTVSRLSGSKHREFEKLDNGKYRKRKRERIVIEETSNGDPEQRSLFD